MRKRPTAVVSFVVFACAMSACGGGGESADQSVIDSASCFGFTAQGSALDDDEMIEDALDEWADLDDDDEAVLLADDAGVCVVYAGPDSFGDMTVTLASEDVAGADGEGGYAVVLSGDRSRVERTGGLDEDTPVLGVAEGTWMLADTVGQADFYVGSTTAVGSSSPVEGQLIDRADPTLPGRDEERVLVVTTADSTFVVAAAESSSSAPPVFLPLLDGGVELADVLGAVGGVPLVAGSVRDGLQPDRPLLSGLELIEAADVADVGTVLASVARHGSTEIPMIHVATEAGLIEHPFEAATVTGWAVGAWLDPQNADATARRTYFALAHPPITNPDAEIEFTIAAGTQRETLAGPLATLDVTVDDDESTVAAIIATADGRVIPTLAANEHIVG